MGRLAGRRPSRAPQAQCAGADTPGPTSTTASSCDAGVVGDSAHPLVPGLAAWETSPEPAGVFNSPPLLMATPFTPSTLSAAEVTSLTTQCHHLHSTPHLCPSC